LKDFDDSTLWRISAYERFRAEAGQSGFARLNESTVLPTTLHAELSRLQHQQRAGDPLEIIAACQRHLESALMLLRLAGLVWPLTLFPRHHLYHLPRPIIETLESGNRDVEVIAVEPPGLRPPGHSMNERVGDPDHYRPLQPLLWALALHGPRADLLDDIAGRAAYRVSASFIADGLALAGALSPALKRLRAEIASQVEIARWPGMDRQRAARLLNAIYLQGGLIVLRAHPAAREGVQGEKRAFGWLRGKR
jgi:hypothetical protein